MLSCLNKSTLVVSLLPQDGVCPRVHSYVLRNGQTDRKMGNPIDSRYFNSVKGRYISVIWWEQQVRAVDPHSFPFLGHLT